MATRRFLSAFKKVAYAALVVRARDYVSARVGRNGPTGGVDFRWLSLLSDVPKRQVNGIARFAALRWAFSEDDDDTLWLRVTHGTQGTDCCCKCGVDTRTYPWGLGYKPLCEECISTCKITPDNALAWCVTVPPALRRALPHCFREEEGCEPPAVNALEVEPCVACGSGDNSIGH